MRDIEEYARDFKVFADTCALMHEAAKSIFLSKLAPHLARYGNPIIVPHGVIREIEKHTKQADTCVAGKQAYDILVKLQGQKLLEIRSEQHEPFVDNVFLYVFQRFITKNDMVLITQDRNLALDVARIRESKSILHKKSIEILMINRRGDLEDWRFLSEAKPKSNLLFNLESSITSVPDALLNLSVWPESGDTVHSPKLALQYWGKK